MKKPYVRRFFFSIALLALPGAVVLVGCGGDEEFATTNSANSATQTAVAPANNAATPGDMNAKEEPPSQPGKYGGTLTGSVISDPKTFNYWVAAETSSTGAVGPLYDALLGRNAYTLQWEGRLAELPQISSDGLTWTFQLKPGLTWSDGQPLTADDVIFTLNVIYDEKVQTNMRESMLLDAPDGKGGFKRVPLKYRKVDARTVEFKFPVAYAPARDILSFPIAPRHKLEASFKAGQPKNTQFNSTWGINTPVRELVASSAWIIQSYVPGQRIVYARNPRYWEKDGEGRPLPYLDRYVSLIVPNRNTETLKFRAGDTDVLQVPHNDYPSIAKGQAKGNYKVINVGPSWGNAFLSFNLNPRSKPARDNPDLIKLFQNQKFRQAVSHAIDRERIARVVYLGLAKPLYGPESPANTVFYNPNIPTFPYDLEKARALLGELGLKDGNGNGVLEINGRDVRFNILTNVENDLRRSTATIIANDLKKVGLGATFTPINFNSLITRADAKPQPGQPYPPYDWEAMVLGFTGGPEPHDGRGIWQSSGNLHQWHPYQKKPATAWEKEIDDIFRKGAQTLDEAERKKLYDRWQVIAAEQLPLIYTVVPEGIYALRNNYGNVKPASLGGVLWNLEELYSLKATRDKP